MDHHLPGDAGVGNSRNGYGRKTVVTETGKIAAWQGRNQDGISAPANFRQSAARSFVH